MCEGVGRRERGGGGGLADCAPSRFHNNIILREHRRVLVQRLRVHVPHMSIDRRSRGTCGHGMWTLGSQVGRLAENGVRVIVPGRGRRVVRRPDHARWRRPPRRRRVRALQQLRSPGILRRVSRPPYHQSYAGKSAGGDHTQNCGFKIMTRKCVCLRVVWMTILTEMTDDYRMLSTCCQHYVDEFYTFFLLILH